MTMATRRTYSIDFDRLEVFEAGALLATIMAYPRETDEKFRSSFHASMCALVLRARFDAAEYSAKPQLMKPCYAFQAIEVVNKDAEILKRRLQDRMAAARMAIAFLQETATGERPRLPKGVKRLSLNQLSEMVLADTRENTPENIEVRVWGASLPVIHLAAATAVCADIYGRKGVSFHVGHLLTVRSVIEWIVREAERYEPLLLRSKRKIDPAKLIKIRLA
jgi:hypothetical protein